MKWFFVVICLSIAGCEAPLIMDAVNEQRAYPIQRSDQFQAVTNNSLVSVAVGSFGVVMVSNDEGLTWRRHILSESATFIDVTSCSNGNIAVLQFEGAIWISSDNGMTWAQKMLVSEETPQAITCDPDNRFWVVASFSTFVMSADNGDNWMEYSKDEDILLTSIQFLDSQNAYAIGEYGTVLRTFDGGVYWDFQDPLPNEFYPQDAYFKDIHNGWVVGLNGRILATKDGGLSWDAEDTGITIPFYGIDGINGTPYAVGAGGIVVSKTGQDWILFQHHKPIRFYLRGVYPIENNKLLVAGGAGALHVLRVE